MDFFRYIRHGRKDRKGNETSCIGVRRAIERMKSFLPDFVTPFQACFRGNGRIIIEQQDEDPNFDDEVGGVRDTRDEILTGSRDNILLNTSGIGSAELRDAIYSIDTASEETVIDITENLSINLSKGSRDMCIDNFIVGEKLGSGGMGSVFAAEWKYCSRTRMESIRVLDVALKRIENPRTDDIEGDVINHQRVSDHLNIATQFGTFMHSSFLFVAMERIQGPDLSDVLRIQSKLTEKQSLMVMCGLFRGLRHVHSKRIGHLDIKPANVMLCRWPISCPDDVRIVDFGLSFDSNNGFQEERNSYPGVCGTVGYTAPEVTFNDRYCPFRADIWSSGVTLFQLLTGSLPFIGDSFISVSTDALSRTSGWLFSDSRISFCNPETISLLSDMLSPNPDYRRNSAEMVQILEQNLPARK